MGPTDDEYGWIFGGDSAMGRFTLCRRAYGFPASRRQENAQANRESGEKSISSIKDGCREISGTQSKMSQREEWRGKNHNRESFRGKCR